MNQSLALSPDGARLAWQGADDEDGRATLGVLDLATGDTSTYHPLPPVERLRLREMSWSPDSAWLGLIADCLARRVGRASTPRARARQPGPPAVRQHPGRGGRRRRDHRLQQGVRQSSSASDGTGDAGPLGEQAAPAAPVGVGTGGSPPTGATIALRSSARLRPRTPRHRCRRGCSTHPFPDGHLRSVAGPAAGLAGRPAAAAAGAGVEQPRQRRARRHDARRSTRPARGAARSGWSRPAPPDRSASPST